MKSIKEALSIVKTYIDKSNYFLKAIYNVIALIVVKLEEQEKSIDHMEDDIVLNEENIDDINDDLSASVDNLDRQMISVERDVYTLEDKVSRIEINIDNLV